MSGFDGPRAPRAAPLFRGSSRFESLILSHHSRYEVTCECNEVDETERHRCLRVIDSGLVGGEVLRGEKTLHSGTDRESYITEHILPYEDKWPARFS